MLKVTALDFTTLVYTLNTRMRTFLNVSELMLVCAEMISSFSAMDLMGPAFDMYIVDCKLIGFMTI